MGFAKLSVFAFVNLEGISMLMLIFKVKAYGKLTQYSNSFTLLPLHVTPLHITLKLCGFKYYFINQVCISV